LLLYSRVPSESSLKKTPYWYGVFFIKKVRTMHIVHHSSFC
jgi:hypothetical protein